jgi:hypothetical protein
MEGLLLLFQDSLVAIMVTKDKIWDERFYKYQDFILSMSNRAFLISMESLEGKIFSNDEKSIREAIETLSDFHHRFQTFIISGKENISIPVDICYIEIEEDLLRQSLMKLGYSVSQLIIGLEAHLKPEWRNAYDLERPAII